MSIARSEMLQRRYAHEGVPLEPTLNADDSIEIMLAYTMEMRPEYENKIKIHNDPADLIYEKGSPLPKATIVCASRDVADDFIKVMNTQEMQVLNDVFRARYFLVSRPNFEKCQLWDEETKKSLRMLYYERATERLEDPKIRERYSLNEEAVRRDIEQNATVIRLRRMVGDTMPTKLDLVHLVYDAVETAIPRQ